MDALAAVLCALTAVFCDCEHPPDLVLWSLEGAAGCAVPAGYGVFAEFFEVLEHLHAHGVLLEGAEFSELLLRACLRNVVVDAG